MLEKKEVKDVVYKEVSHSWTDMWADKEVVISYRFRRPTPAEIKRMQAGAAKNANTAAYQLMCDTVHPEDLEKMRKNMEDYPALIPTISSALLKSCGLADLGNA